MNKSLQLFNFFLLLSTCWITPKNTIAQSGADINELTFASAQIIVRDLKTSATWYRKFLKFKVKEYKPEKHVKMENGSFQLTLIKGKNTLLLREITFTKGKKYVNGIDKIGFSTNQFDSLNIYFQRYKQKYYKPVSFDENLGVRSMEISDPDGNKLVFLDEPGSEQKFTLRPSFFSINSSDYINTLKWYTTHFNFKEMELNDDSKSHFQNLLRQDGITLELIHLPYESLETTEFMPLDRDLASFDRIAFRTGLGKKVKFELDNNGNKIVLRK